ncbi:Esterase OS=Streptomyces antimycoticus OX=68175 GN=SANT12839_076770 PE=4 SV=1 [Streptomyces antimycoticus]
MITEEDLTDVVLVGHSYAGLVISSTANQLPDRIAQLVYLDAMVPEDGETAADVMPFTQAMIDQALASESGWRIPPLVGTDPVLGSVRGHRSGGRGVAALDDVGSVGALPAATGPAGQPGRERDPADAYPLRRQCAAGHDPAARTAIQPNGSPAQVWELETGHDCMITMPGELAELLLKLG